MILRRLIFEFHFCSYAWMSLTCSRRLGGLTCYPLTYLFAPGRHGKPQWPPSPHRIQPSSCGCKARQPRDNRWWGDLWTSLQSGRKKMGTNREITRELQMCLCFCRRTMEITKTDVLHWLKKKWTQTHYNMKIKTCPCPMASNAFSISIPW